MISRKLLQLWQHLREGERRLVEPSSGWSLSILLVFPNYYSVGVSNLGLQTVYRVLNQHPGFVCDLVYLPEEPYQVELDAGAELVSLYLERTPMEFDVILFSISFENDLLNVVKLLKYMRIPVLSEERDDSHPLVVGGGVVPTANPEPFAPIFDLIYLGEAEVGLVEILEMWADAPERKKFLEKVKDLPWAYVPSVVELDDSGPFWVPSGLEKKRAYSKNFPVEGNFSVIISKKSTFPDTHIVEVSRGCPRRCKFCLSSHLIRPVRFVETQRILELARESPSKKIGLLGTAVSDHRGLRRVVEEASDLTFTFSSIRVDAHPSLFDALRRSGAKSIALGIEAATERLRSLIGKPIEDDLIVERARELSGCFETLKLYFMVGLPFEEEEDVEALGSLLEKIRKVFEGRISLSVAPFVPKPFTPFEREPFLDLSVIKARLKRMKKEALRFRGVFFNHDLPRWSKIQALISRGDRRVGLHFAGRQRKLDEHLYLSRIPSEVRVPWEFVRPL